VWSRGFFGKNLSSEQGPLSPEKEPHVRILNLIPVYIHYHSQYFDVVPRSRGAQSTTGVEWSGVKRREEKRREEKRREEFL
jgi:hypothetical protein